MSILHSHASEFGKRLCEVLGFGDQPVRSIYLRVDTDSAVTATVEKYVTNAEGERILALLKDYELVRRTTALQDTAQHWDKP